MDPTYEEIQSAVNKVKQLSLDPGIPELARAQRETALALQGLLVALRQMDDLEDRVRDLEQSAD
jgi:hypothetical protein